MATSNNVQAKFLQQPVGSYALDCNNIFSCPESLKPRVSFWIEVFSRWDTDTAIFHDKDNPHRVYSTLKREKGCRGSRNGDAISRERKRLNRELKTIAGRVAKGRSLSSSQAKLEAMFIGQPVSEVRAAADRIRCQSGNRNRMRNALEQFQLYRPTILDALESQNLTPELQYLPFVESAFDPEALSHVGAAGLWQIMPSTGRTLGLTVNSVVDERYDPTYATYAAAKYFRNSVDNLTETAFENGYSVTAKDLNPFVITSYNYGVKGMQRAIKQVGLNYEKLLLEYKSPNFQTAVKNFYASFLAARYVAKNSAQFFDNLVADPSARTHAFNTVTLSKSASAKRINKVFNVDISSLDKLNPSLKKNVWKGKALIPKGYKLKLPFKQNGWSSQVAQLKNLPNEYIKPGFVWHRVKSGQTACGIARKYKASCRSVRKLNKLNKRGTIYTGQRLKIPSKNGGIGVSSGSSIAKSNALNSTETQKYRVKSGESACLIAQRYKMKCADFLAINGMSRRSVLKAGQRVLVASNSAGMSSKGRSSTQRYRVRSGDTACGIADKYKMKCSEFLALNGMQRKSLLRVGQRVVVSAQDSWHTVRKGQSACSIAQSYRVKCSALLDANRLKRSSVIQAGQRLRIPSEVN